MAHLPRQTVCAWCHRIRRPDGSWTKQPRHLSSALSHGICPDCVARETAAATFSR